MQNGRDRQRRHVGQLMLHCSEKAAGLVWDVWALVEVVGGWGMQCGGEGVQVHCGQGIENEIGLCRVGLWSGCGKSEVHDS